MLKNKNNGTHGYGHEVANKLPFIDSLRGVAIIMVIITHHGQQFTIRPWKIYFTDFGQLGVQLFFALSAYTLCMSADGRVVEKNSARNFYIRRYFRIAPLYYIGILMYGTVEFINYGYIEFLKSYSFLNVMSNILLVHGVYIPANNVVVPGGWSIGTEILFYAIFPFIIPIFNWAKNSVARFAILFISSILINSAFQIIIFKTTGMKIQNNTFLYYFITNQIPVFMLGACAYYIKPRKGVCIYLAMFLVGSMSAMTLLYFATPKDSLLLPPVAGLAFFGLVRLAEACPYRSGLLERIGQASYSMYIFHFLFAVFATSMVLRISGHTRGIELLLYLPTLLAAIFSTYAIARISKWLLEDRFIAIGRQIIRRMA